ncbi:unnamed protein product [Rotaria sp. Silwood2]|nr:unnamed protein product [Rotaria sp. Silwood2]CAF4533617.1 unnamed protein product [Rotaria sp. Silwood2]
MSNAFRIEDLDALNTRKIHELTRTELDTIKFLQDVKLLPMVPRPVDQCRNKCNDWRLEKRSLAADGD